MHAWDSVPGTVNVSVSEPPHARAAIAASTTGDEPEEDDPPGMLGDEDRPTLHACATPLDPFAASQPISELRISGASTSTKGWNQWMPVQRRSG